MAKILTKNCLICAKLFEKPSVESLRNWENRHKYCSRECAYQAPRSQETRLKQRQAKLGKSSWNKGIPMREETKQKFRELFAGKPLSEETRKKMPGRRPWNKIGDGITSVNERIRKSPEYKQWRQEVYERDNFSCVDCGKRGGDLQADHIKAFALYPELRFVVSNGRTLCKPCHRKTETYGINQHTYPQLKR